VGGEIASIVAGTAPNSPNGGCLGAERLVIGKKHGTFRKFILLKWQLGGGNIGGEGTCFVERCIKGKREFR